MQYIRLVHPHNYDPDLGKFNDLAFKKSSDGSGMSIVQLDCAQSKSGSICAHIDRFYKGVSGEPPIFYILEQTELPQAMTLTRTDSGTGDNDCHFAGDGIGNGPLKKAFKDKREWKYFHTCDKDGVHRPLTEEDVKEFKLY